MLRGEGRLIFAARKRRVLCAGSTIDYQQAKLARRQSRTKSMFAPDLLKAAGWRAFVMLRPDLLWKNPVMFVVEIGTLLSIIYTAVKVCDPDSTQATLGYLIAAGRLALRDGVVRQLRGSTRRGARQGPGGRPAEDPAGDTSAARAECENQGAEWRSLAHLGFEPPCAALADLEGTVNSTDF